MDRGTNPPPLPPLSVCSANRRPLGAGARETLRGSTQGLNGKGKGGFSLDTSCCTPNPAAHHLAGSLRSQRRGDSDERRMLLELND